MGKKYNYSAFGIQFESDIELPQFYTCTVGCADVQIIYGDVPNQLDCTYEQNEVYQLADQEFLFRVDGVANFYVTDGEQIVIQRFKRDLRQIRLYLLGTVMGVLMMQRGILPIHGSSVVLEGQCIILAGVSGAGKSTMAAALHKNGHFLLSDDLSAVKFDKQGMPWVQSGYPQQKLWQTSASVLGINTYPFPPVCENMDKYAVPVDAGFCGRPMPLSAVYEIIENLGNTGASIRQVNGVKKIATIMHHTYRSGLIRGSGLKLAHFNQCVTIARHIPIYQLTRSESIQSLYRQVDVLERHCAELLQLEEEKSARNEAESRTRRY